MKYYLIKERKKLSDLGYYWDWVEPISFGYDSDGDLKTMVCNTSGGTMFELQYPSDFTDIARNFIQLDYPEDNAEYIDKLNQKMSMLRTLTITMAVDVKEFEKIYLHSGKDFDELEDEFDSKEYTRKKEELERKSS
ncbi:MAG: hypothetical protein CMM04_16645 [Rhodopirellula sp.]|nr:hypothetical protein [Rhodopirellula sp.]